MADKALGWRPYNADQRANFAELGFTDEQIAEMEANNTYSPDPTAVQALHLGLAILEGGIKHLGPTFADDVRNALDGRVARLRAGDQGDEDLVEAPMVEALANALDWERLISRASEQSGHDEQKPLQPRG